MLSCQRPLSLEWSGLPHKHWEHCSELWWVHKMWILFLTLHVGPCFLPSLVLGLGVHSWHYLMPLLSHLLWPHLVWTLTGLWGWGGVGWLRDHSCCFSSSRKCGFWCFLYPCSKMRRESCKDGSQHSDWSCYIYCICGAVTVSSIYNLRENKNAVFLLSKYLSICNDVMSQEDYWEWTVFPGWGSVLWCCEPFCK